MIDQRAPTRGAPRGQVFWAPSHQLQHDSDRQSTPLAVNWIALVESWLLVPFVVVVVVTAAITFGETRHRASAEVPIVLLASVAVDALLSRRRLRSL